MEVVVDSAQPLGRHVTGHELDLRQARAHLTDGALDVVGELLELVPGHVGDRVPLPDDRLVVEQASVLGPYLRHVVHRVHRQRFGAGRHLAAARGHAAVRRAVLGDLPVVARLDVAHPQSRGAGCDLVSPPRGVGLHPLQVEIALRHVAHAVESDFDRGRVLSCRVLAHPGLLLACARDGTLRRRADTASLC